MTWQVVAGQNLKSELEVQSFLQLGKLKYSISLINIITTKVRAGKSVW